MTLVTSGDISIFNGITTRSIAYELYKDNDGTPDRGLVEVSLEASKTPNHAMTEFYGYSHITTIPNAPTIGTPVWASIASIYQSVWTNNNTGGLVERTYVETNRNGAGWVVEGYVTNTTSSMDNNMICGSLTATTRVRHWNIIGYSAYSAISSAISIAC